MLKQLLNGNNSLLLILTPKNTDLSIDLLLLSVSVILWRLVIVQIKLLSLKYKLAGILKHNLAGILKIQTGPGAWIRKSVKVR